MRDQARREPTFSYLLRLWPAEEHGQLVWRASLQDARTGERMGFSSTERLFAFLQDQAASVGEDGGDEEWVG